MVEWRVLEFFAVRAGVLFAERPTCSWDLSRVARVWCCSRPSYFSSRACQWNWKERSIAGQTGHFLRAGPMTTPARPGTRLNGPWYVMCRVDPPRWVLHSWFMGSIHFSINNDMGFFHWSYHPLFTYHDLRHPTKTFPKEEKFLGEAVQYVHARGKISRRDWVPYEGELQEYCTIFGYCTDPQGNNGNVLWQMYNTDCSALNIFLKEVWMVI